MRNGLLWGFTGDGVVGWMHGISQVVGIPLILLFIILRIPLFFPLLILLFIILLILLFIILLITLSIILAFKMHTDTSSCDKFVCLYSTV